MHDGNVTATAQVPAKKQSKGNRNLTIIFYTVYVLLILSFLGGLHFARQRLTTVLAEYEASHISVASQDVFDQLFTQPDWNGLYALAGLKDTRFENAGDFVSYMEARADGKVLTYAQITADMPESHSYQVMLEGESIGTFTLTDCRASDDKWPYWQLTGFTLEAPRTITVQILKQDDHTVFVNGIRLNGDDTIRIDTTLAEAYLPAGTDGDSMHLQQVTGLLNPPEILITDPEGNPCPVNQDPDTGIYTQQLPEAAPMTAEEEALILKTAEVYSMFKLKAATEGYLSLYFKPTEQAYKDTVSSGYWVDSPGGCQITDAHIVDFCRIGDSLFHARVTLNASTLSSEAVHTLDATVFFEIKSGAWTCAQVAQGDTRVPISRVRLDFYVDDAPVYYDFYFDASTRIRVPAATAPEGCVFSGWAAQDGSLILIPDETGYAPIPDGTLLKPTALFAVFEEIEGGN